MDLMSDEFWENQSINEAKITFYNILNESSEASGTQS